MSLSLQEQVDESIISSCVKPKETCMAISIPGAMDFLVMVSNPPIFCDVSTGIHQKILYLNNCLFSKIENFGVKKSSPLLLPLKFWCQFFGGWGFYTPCPPLPLPDSHRFNLSAIIWDGRFRHPCQLLGHPTNAGGDETPQKKDERKCRFRKKKHFGGRR